MAIDVNKIKWADNLEVDPVSGLPNKVEPPEELKLSGTKRAQNLTRQHFNYILDQYHEMFGDLQQQINDLTVSAGVGTLNAVFPVGSYWFNGVSDANPSVSLGFGTWVRVLGRFLVGVDEGDTTWDAGLKTGGAKNHTHTASTNSAGSHSHTGSTSSNGAHNHGGTTGVFVPTVGAPDGSNVSAAVTHSHSIATEPAHSHTLSINSSGNHTHTVTVTNSSNLPPFEAAFVWRRTA